MVPETWLPTSTFVTGSIVPVAETVMATVPVSTGRVRHFGLPWDCARHMSRSAVPMPTATANIQMRDRVTRPSGRKMGGTRNRAQADDA